MLDVGRRPRTVSLLATLVALTVLALAAASPLHAQVAGPNVNMVSGTQWPTGDPFLQRQNEPSVAVSTRNPSHLLAGANDYRTVDLPLVGTDEVGDAWLGVFKSFDGGLTWQSTLLPGYPQDTSGTPSPLKGFKAAADPVVRAGTDGLFYYSGITFNRGSNVGQVFVSRFLDLNNREGGDATQKDPIKYVDATVIETGTSGQFLDKPWLAVDVPRGAATCTIAVDGQTQTVGAGIVYMAYAKFTGSNTANSQVMFVRSLDCGKTWSKPIKISPNDHKNQGTNVAVDPASGTVYVTYRRFDTNSQNADALVVLKSTDFGQTFSAGVDAALITPFDQFTTPTQFRTATLPALAASVDGNGVSRVHLAWAQRTVAGGDARIVVSTSRDGVSWSTPVPVDGQPLTDDFGGSFSAGHQFMPSMTFGEGRLMVLYYDQRLDQTLGRYQPRNPFEPTAAGSFYLERRQSVATPAPFGSFITEPASGTRRLLELRIARAFPADLDSPAPATSPFQSSRVSRFRFGADSGAAESPSELDQLDVNPPNLPMFKQGTLPFIGDYIEVAGLTFVKTAAGWKHNTDLTSAPTFHAVWTSNQDVVPPPDGHWEKFTPLGAAGPSLYDPTVSRSACVTGFEGTRNQNVYSSRISEGLLVYSPQNAKPLDVPRAFVVIAQNLTPFAKTFRFNLVAPSGVYASFQNQKDGLDQFLDTFDVVIPANSSISRSVFTKASAALAATITVNVAEIAGVAGAPLPTGLWSTLLLNPPGSFGGSTPSLVQPDGSSGAAESYTATISAASVTSPNLASVTSASVTSASVTSASVTSASVTSASVTSTNVASPQLASVTSASVTSASVTSYNISDASVTSQPMASVTSGNLFASVTSASVTSAAISDANYEIKNTGNTTHSYHVKLVGQAPANTPIQLILSRPYATPFAVNCQPWLVYRPVTVVNVDDVSNDLVTSASEVPNPDIPDPRASNATITLAPGESGVITVRGPLGLAAMTQLATTLVPAVVPHAGGNYAAPLLITSDSAGLPALLVGVPYSATLTAIGGTGTPVWTLVSGSLPAGLTLSPGGLISGTPTATGSTSGTVQVSAGGSSATKEITFSVAAGPSITSLTVSSTTPVYGSPVTLTATVSATSAGASVAAPVGTVVFKDGAATLGSATPAGAAGQSTATLQLTSLAAVTHAISVEYSGDANYAKSTSNVVSLTVSPARPTVSVTGGTFTFDKAAHPATASVVGLGGSPVAGTLSITYSPGGTLEPVNAGSYAVTATFLASDTNYEPSTSASGTVVVLKAAPKVVVGGGPFAYDGQPHAATAGVTGIADATVSGTTSFSYTPGGSAVPVAAGTYAVAASFTSSDPNYANGTGSGSITIGATVPTVTVTGGPFVYDGIAHAATAIAKGVAGVTVQGTFAFTYNGQATAPTNAGSYAVLASFTSGDANYGNATGNGTLVINPATPSVAVAGGPFTYDFSPHPASAIAVGVGGAPVAGGFTISYTPGGASAPVAVGTYGVAAAFSSANNNYTNAAGAGTLVVNKAATTTTVTSSLPTSGAGVQVTFTASVKPAPALPAGAAAPSGTVTFKDGTTTLGTATLAAGGTATLSTSTLTAGTHTITVVYAGDGTFNGSTSAALTQTVKTPYAFTGFDTPLVAAGTLAAPSNSGSWSYRSVLPVKWQLRDSAGALVTSLASTKVLAAWFAGATCSTTATPPPMPDPVPTDPKLLPAGLVILYNPTSGAAGGSTFRSGSTGFIFNWDATKASKGQGCYWIRLQLDDGSPEKVTRVLLN